MKTLYLTKSDFTYSNNRLEYCGIDVRKKETSCDGKEVVIDGKTYILQEKK